MRTHRDVGSIELRMRCQSHRGHFMCSIGEDDESNSIKLVWQSRTKTALSTSRIPKLSDKAHGLVPAVTHPPASTCRGTGVINRPGATAYKAAIKSLIGGMVVGESEVVQSEGRKMLPEHINWTRSGKERRVE